MVSKRKYMTHSIIIKLFSILMKGFFNWGQFLLSNTDSSPDENGPMVQALHSSDLERLLWII